MSQDLWMIFKSKDSQSIMTAACQSLNGGGDRPAVSPSQQVVYEDKTPAKTELGTSVAAFENQLWVGYVEPENGALCLVASNDGGQTFKFKFRLGHDYESQDPPALVVFNDQLWMFWRSRQNGALHCSTLGAGDDARFSEPVIMQDHESGQRAAPLCAPAAAVFQGALWVAYVDARDQNIYFARYVDGGSTLQVGMYLSVDGKDISSKATPALAVWNDRLYMFWRSRSDDTLYFSSVDSWDVLAFTAQQKITDEVGATPSHEPAKTPLAPAAATFEGALCVAYVDTWKGDIKIARSTDGKGFGTGIYMGREDISSNQAPALYADVGITGTIRPKFQLMSILYSPPGGNGVKASSVEYWNGSSAGSTVSISGSTQNSFKVSAKAEAAGNSVEAGFEQKVSSSSSRDLTVTKEKSQKWTLKVEEQTDGIDHGNDVFMLVVNPVVKATSGAIGNLTWSLDTDEKSSQVPLPLRLIYPTVDTANDDIQDLMKTYGFTEEDFQRLAQCHPFCNATTIDRERFQLVWKVPYRASTNVTSTNELSTTTSGSYTSSSTASLTVSCSLSSEFAVAGFSAKVTASNEFEWQTSSSNTKSDEVSQVAIAVIACPSKTITGKSDVYIYLDKIYNTFMFSFDPDPLVSADAVPYAAVISQE